MWLFLGLFGIATAAFMNDISPFYKDLNKASDVTFSVALDGNGQINLSWSIDHKLKTILYDIHFSKKSPSFEWFAFGWSDYGSMINADYCLLWFTWTGKANLMDTYSNKLGALHNDEPQDCDNFEWNENTRTLKFSRFIDTCDPKDYVVEDGTTHLVWARGFELSKTKPLDVSSVKESDKGMVRVQLLKGSAPPENLPPEARPIYILANKVKVPDSDTTYWCHVHKLPDWLIAKPHHIIRFEKQITPGNEGLVHHMEVFYCDAEANSIIDNYAGSCFSPKRPNSTQVCTKVKAAWAMGASAFIYPTEAGLPIGGSNKNSYVMLEVHYNNPQLKSDWIDSSGILMYVTSKLRKYNAAIMELGLEYTDKMAIPPKQEKFQLSGYCISDCTKIGLPKNGIFIFGSQLHTHLTGTRVVTRHFRNGVELPLLNEDNHYSTHFQEIRLLKKMVHVYPGDSLITTCDYKTNDRSNITFGGHAITDEMCVNYIHYYPATSLEVCKSSVGTDALHNYFAFEYEWDDMALSFNKTIRENYNQIKPWNPLRVSTLNDLYLESPISMQCNASNGDRFPGEWDNINKDVILHELKPPKRSCPRKG